MKDLSKFISRAKRSKFHLWILNQVLWRAVPFNKPHKFVINKIEDDGISLRIPFIRRNLNHIKGLHACVQATAAEYITGLTLMYLLGNGKYRMVMQKLEIEYHYQGKMAASASYSLTKGWIKQNIEMPVENEGVAAVTCTVEIYDDNGNKLSTSKIQWHFKPWEKVKTSL